MKKVFIKGSQFKGVTEISVVQHMHFFKPKDLTRTSMTLLMVPIEVQAIKGEALLDTGCTFTLMQLQHWQKFTLPMDKLLLCPEQAFVLADGKTHGTLGRTQLTYLWNNA